jgi:hypothetical protein
MSFQERFLNIKGSEKLFGNAKFAGLPILFDDQYVKNDKITAGMKTRKNYPLNGAKPISLVEDLAYFSTEEQIKAAETNFQKTYGGGGGYYQNNDGGYNGEDEDDEAFDDQEDDEEEE